MVPRKQRSPGIVYIEISMRFLVVQWLLSAVARSFNGNRRRCRLNHNLTDDQRVGKNQSSLGFLPRKLNLPHEDKPQLPYASH